jgi:hypothetical protein
MRGATALGPTLCSRKQRGTGHSDRSFGSGLARPSKLDYPEYPTYCGRCLGVHVGVHTTCSGCGHVFGLSSPKSQRLDSSVGFGTRTPMPAGRRPQPPRHQHHRLTTPDPPHILPRSSPDVQFEYLGRIWGGCGEDLVGCRRSCGHERQMRAEGHFVLLLVLLLVRGWEGFARHKCVQKGISPRRGFPVQENFLKSAKRSLMRPNSTETPSGSRPAVVLWTFRHPTRRFKPAAATPGRNPVARLIKPPEDSCYLFGPA